MPDDYYSTHLIRKLNPYSEAMVSTLKSMDRRIFGDMAVSPVALLISGHFYDNRFNRITEDQFLNMMKEIDSEVVVKLDGGPSGTGLFFRLSKELTTGDFQKGQNYLIQPVIKQHPVLNQLNASSLNTLRIMTFLSPGNQVEILFAIVKFGTKGRRIDNLDMGGCCLFLNYNGESVSGAYDILGLRCNGTGQTDDIDDLRLKIPSFGEVKTLCIDAHKKFPYVQLIGWDVAIRENGKPILVEWNARCPGLLPEEALIGPVFPDIHSLL